VTARRAARPLPRRYRRVARRYGFGYAFGDYWNRYVWAFYSAPGRWLHGCDCDQCAEARRKWGGA
jgi:hypothetical protein